MIGSDEKSGGGGLTSSGGGGGAKGRSIKTVGRSRLVPACPSPTFDCEWQVESEVSRRALLILEVRTGSRELLNSVNVALGDLFTGETYILLLLSLVLICMESWFLISFFHSLLPNAFSPLSPFFF